jgi:hypothetical protein
MLTFACSKTIFLNSFSTATEGRLKSQYEAKITSLEKELAEVKEAASVNSQMTDLKANVEKLEKEKSE